MMTRSPVDLELREAARHLWCRFDRERQRHGEMRWHWHFERLRERPEEFQRERDDCFVAAVRLWSAWYVIAIVVGEAHGS